MNGKNTIPRETYRRFSELVAVLYEDHAVGGPLHIITDDYNVRNGDIEFCRGESVGNAGALEILDILEPLTMQERYWLVTHDNRHGIQGTLDEEVDHWYPSEAAS